MKCNHIFNRQVTLISFVWTSVCTILLQNRFIAVRRCLGRKYQRYIISGDAIPLLQFAYIIIRWRLATQPFKIMVCSSVKLCNLGLPISEVDYNGIVPYKVCHDCLLKGGANLVSRLSKRQCRLSAFKGNITWNITVETSRNITETLRNKLRKHYALYKYAAALLHWLFTSPFLSKVYALFPQMSKKPRGEVWDHFLLDETDETLLKTTVICKYSG